MLSISSSKIQIAILSCGGLILDSEISKSEILSLPYPNSNFVLNIYISSTLFYKKQIF